MINPDALTNMVQRRSCRSYKNEQISDVELNAVLKAGTFAPTGRGLQSPKMVVVQNKEIIEKLSKINAEIMGADVDPFYGAPTVVIVFADSRVNTYLEDGTLVMGNLLLAAHACDLGACWIHRAKQTFETEEGKALMKEWGLDENYVGIGNCILGYAASPLPEAKPRKDDYIIYVK